jgi:Zn-dependent membrane protease YugP
MHPVIIVIPAAILIFGPRAWVNRLLRKHEKNVLNTSVTAREFARDSLDRQGLQRVKVESTDIGDHYDQQAKAVRLARSRIDSRSLTALTTAAHEVAHALQDASDYPPFVWRTHLSRVAQMAGQLGAVMLVAAPLLSLSTHRPFPFRAMGSAIFGVMGAGLVAQLAALPSEFDASFNRAIPMLREGSVSDERLKDARLILVACSTTYVAASLVSLLNFWPWFIHGVTASPSRPRRRGGSAVVAQPLDLRNQPGAARKSVNKLAVEPLVRQLGKPLIRCWLQLSRCVARSEPGQWRGTGIAGGAVGSVFAPTRR